MSATPAGKRLADNVWHLFDAKDQVVGRLASTLAQILVGKHKPTLQTNLVSGDNIVVVNAAKVKFTGNKWDTKIYRRHTMWVGGLKEVPARDMLAKHPERILRLAVSGMLPKNALREERLKKLKIYNAEEHPHTAQFPAALSVPPKAEQMALKKFASFNKESIHLPTAAARKDVD